MVFFYILSCISCKDKGSFRSNKHLFWISICHMQSTIKLSKKPALLLFVKAAAQIFVFEFQKVRSSLLLC